MCPLPRTGHVNSAPPVALEMRCAPSVAVLPVTVHADLTAGSFGGCLCHIRHSPPRFNAGHFTADVAAAAREAVRQHSLKRATQTVRPWR
jgi:hypothetical protein